MSEKQQQQKKTTTMINTLQKTIVIIGRKAQNKSPVYSANAESAMELVLNPSFLQIYLSLPWRNFIYEEHAQKQKLLKEKIFH